MQHNTTQQNALRGSVANEVKRMGTAKGGKRATDFHELVAADGVVLKRQVIEHHKAAKRHDQRHHLPHAHSTQRSTAQHSTHRSAAAQTTLMSRKGKGYFLISKWPTIALAGENR
jgi:hypothetical protein